MIASWTSDSSRGASFALSAEKCSSSPGIVAGRLMWAGVVTTLFPQQLILIVSEFSNFAHHLHNLLVLSFRRKNPGRIRLRATARLLATDILSLQHESNLCPSG